MTLTVSAMTIVVLGILVLVAISAALITMHRRSARMITSELLEEARKLETELGQPEAADTPGGEPQYLQALLSRISTRLSEYRDQLTEVQQQAEQREADFSDELSRREKKLADSLRDVEVSKEHLYHMAYHDSLTSLPNRRLFKEQLEQLLRMAERHGEQLAILFIDLDDFKRINDSVGHSAGMNCYKK